MFRLLDVFVNALYYRPRPDLQRHREAVITQKCVTSTQAAVTQMCYSVSTNSEMCYSTGTNPEMCYSSRNYLESSYLEMCYLGRNSSEMCYPGVLLRPN